MSHQLVNHSPDLKKLRDEGYEVEVLSGHLLVKSVPYVNNRGEIALGTLVSTLNLAGDRTAKPETHVAYFIGERPCNKDGAPIEEIFHNDTVTTLAPSLVVNVMFSSKPEQGYNDYYHKMGRYAEIISAPAWSIDKKSTPKTFNVIPETQENSVFHYIDSNSSRAGITNISEKFKSQRIAIVGLGGTGAYILDLVAKTPVLEIHLFDDDAFQQHNAFRAPGAASLEELAGKPSKVDYLTGIYSKMRKAIIPYNLKLDADNVHLLGEMDFVFICLDKGSPKKSIFPFLEAANIAFIDVGMGLEIVDDAIFGIIRTTTCIAGKTSHISSLVSMEDNDDNVYSSNIQTSDLNMLNAAFAVVKWKKICGFYSDFEGEVNSTYTTNVNMLT